MIYSFLTMLSLFFSPVVKNNSVQTITLEQLQAKTIHQNNDTLYIVNFWASWCKPCVAELPYFEQAEKTFADKKVSVLLVSLDFLSDKEKVNRFITKENIQSKVYLLDAGDPNVWINKIDTTWSGTIPATIMYKKGKKVFFQEGDFASQHQLNAFIKTNL